MAKRKKPAVVKEAVKLLWYSVLIDGISAFVLFPSLAIWVILPAALTHMIDKGKNWARYLFTAWFLFSLLTILPSSAIIFTPDLIGLAVLSVLILRGYGLYLLFQHKSKLWFAHNTLSKLKRN